MDEEQLLSQVFASPASDAPRIALADHLTRRGDPRGEFITLALSEAKKPSRKGKKRLDELQTLHWTSWVGSLSNVLSDSGLEFHRGFLSSCIIGPKRRGFGTGLGPKGDDLSTVGGHPPFFSLATDLGEVSKDPHWCTVERLHMFATDQASEELLASPHLGNLRSIRNISLSTLAWLAAGPVRLIEKANVHAYHPPSESEASALIALGGLPHLEELDGFWALCQGKKATEGYAFPWLVDGQLSRQLRTLNLGVYAVIAMPDWLEALARSTSIEKVDCGDVQLVRDSNNRLAQLEIEIRGPFPGHVGRMLETLKIGAISTIVIHGTVGLARRPDTVEKLREHGKRLGATVQVILPAPRKKS